MDGFAEEELGGWTRSLYPRWNLTGRPALPASIRSADLVHAMERVRSPARGRGPAPGRHGARPGVRPLSGPVPEGVESDVPARAGGGRPRRGRSTATPSRTTAEDVLSRTKVDPGKLHVVPEAAALPSSDVDVGETLWRL